MLNKYFYFFLIPLFISCNATFEENYGDLPDPSNCDCNLCFIEFPPMTGVSDAGYNSRITIKYLADGYEQQGDRKNFTTYTTVTTSIECCKSIEVSYIYDFRVTGITKRVTYVAIVSPDECTYSIPFTDFKKVKTDIIG